MPVNPEEWIPRERIMAHGMPKTTQGHRFFDELFIIYQELGSQQFLDWAEKAVRPQDTWEHTVRMMAWNDRNSEFNLDRNIAKFRKTREGERITEEDVAAALESMLQGMV
jgi:hypothetical protein